MAAKLPAAIESGDSTASAAALVVAGAVCILSAWLMTLGGQFPFVWIDVAVAHLLCALPLAQVVTRQFGRRATGRVAWLASTLILIITVAATSQAQLWPVAIRELEWPAATLLRSGIALAAATSALILAQSMPSTWMSRPAPSHFERTSWNYLLLFSSVLFAALVPAAYTQSRVLYYVGQLSDAVSQHRLGQARLLANRLNELAPRSQIGGRPIGQVAADLDLQVQDLLRQVSRPLAEATPNALLERARLHAILGQVDEARRTLEPLVRTRPPHPAACLLLGTAYESREDWRTSRHWYEKARTGIMPIASSPPARPALVQAINGIAYTERKMGRYREAETAYRQSLALSPTAEMHFLLAQFYDDGQQTAQAHEHALAAARLDPRRFGGPAEHLINKLATGQFGCFSVYAHSKTALPTGPNNASNAP